MDDLACLKYYKKDVIMLAGILLTVCDSVCRWAQSVFEVENIAFDLKLSASQHIC